MNFGERIKCRREQLGMTQDELAFAVGYSGKTSIAKIETGVSDVSRSKVAELAKALKTSPSYLMGWEDDPVAEVRYAAKMSHGLSVEDLTKDDILAIEQFIEFTRERRNREKNEQGGDT